MIGVHHFPPHYSGGAEQRALRTATALQQRNHQIKVICVEHVDRGPDQGAVWEDDTYQGISVRRLSFNLSKVTDRVTFEYNNPWIQQQLETILREENPHVFHLIGGYLLSASTLLGAYQNNTPTVLTLTDFWFLCPRITLQRSDGSLSTLPINPVICARCLGETSRRYRIPAKIFPALMEAYWRRQTTKIRQVQTRLDFLKSTLNRVDRIIYPSQFLGDIYVQAGVDRQRMAFCRQGQDFPDLSPDKLLKTSSSSLRLAYMGQIAQLKGIHVLLEAIKQLPSAPLKLTIYGDETPFPAYTQRLHQIAGNDPRIVFAGRYQRQEISHILQEVDIVVMPSLWYENSPNIILECFAHRTPVIASNLGGMAELVQHDENGLLFSPGNTQDLANQIQRLLDEPDVVRRLQAGIPPVKSLSQEIDELESIYTDIIR